MIDGKQLEREIKRQIQTHEGRERSGYERADRQTKGRHRQRAREGVREKNREKNKHTSSVLNYEPAGLSLMTQRRPTATI